MFFASLLGIIAPYWFIVPWYLYRGLGDRLYAHVESLITFQPLVPYRILDEHLLISFAMVFLVGIIGVFHFLRNASKDKIRTRMLYYIFITMFLLTSVFIGLQPQHFESLFGFMIVNASALFAHYLALTHTRFTNITFIVLTILMLAITAYNLWMPSLMF